MSEEHDKTHRLIFAFPRMIEAVIRLCLGGEWVERLDFSTLEKVPERLLSSELVRREQDVFWRLRYLAPEEDDDEWFYVYLHLEHMSRPRRLMALDTTTYKLLALKELSRRKQLPPSKKLPPIFSAVLYTGEKKWPAITSLLELLKVVPDAPEGLDLWSFRFIDLHRYPLEEWVGLESPLRSLFQLERLQDIGDLPELAQELQATLPPEDQDLADAFVELINEVVLRRLTPKGAPQIRITDLEEVPSMLARTIDNITRGWEKRGWEKGRKKGQEEGRKKGQEEGRKKGQEEEAAHMFLELYAARYGTVSAEVRRRVGSASKQQLETWAKRLLTAEGPDDVFND